MDEEEDELLLLSAEPAPAPPGGGPDGGGGGCGRFCATCCSVMLSLPLLSSCDHNASAEAVVPPSFMTACSSSDFVSVPSPFISAALKSCCANCNAGSDEGLLSELAPEEEDELLISAIMAACMLSLKLEVVEPVAAVDELSLEDVVEELEDVLWPSSISSSSFSKAEAALLADEEEEDDAC